MLTDLQLKILKYISKRKTLATAKEIQLQTRTSLATVSRALKTLTNRGCIRSKSAIVGFVKVRQYELVKMVPDEITSTKKICVKFAKSRVTLDTKYFHNPFGINNG
jgi:DNA-binding Lrp family transcriptional regulator